MLLLLAAGTAGFFASRPMSAQEALILKNVEALASGEDPISTQQCLNPLFFQANSGAASTYTLCAEGTDLSTTYACPTTDARGFASSDATYYTCTR